MEKKIFIDKGDPFEYCFFMELEFGVYSCFINDDEIGPYLRKVKELLNNRLPQYEKDNIPVDFDLDAVSLRYTYSKCNFNK